MTNPLAEIRHMRHVKDGVERLWDVVAVWCPGCECIHWFDLPPGDFREVHWEWNGSLECPTFSPSLLCYSSVHLCGEHEHVICEDYDNCEQVGHAIGYKAPSGEINWRTVTNPEEYEKVYAHGGTPHTVEPAWGNCHSFLRNGVWEFLSDSAHKLAGQSVIMVPLPDWLVKED